MKMHGLPLQGAGVLPEAQAGHPVHHSDKLPHAGTVEKNFPHTAKSAAAQSAAHAGKVPAQAERTAVQQSAALAHLFKSLGLPADQLSQSIISFAKFFSLPLDPALLSRIRRASTAARPETGGGALKDAAQQALSGRAAGGAGSEAAALLKGREALALAGLAAADKGAELRQPALDEYAAAIDPDSRGDTAHDADTGGGHSPPQDQSADNPPPNGSENDAALNDATPDLPPPPADILGEPRPMLSVQAQSVLAQLLKGQFVESAERSPALDLLNRLPGRNGRRWLTFPLNFSENGLLFRVSLRILFDRDSAGQADTIRRLSVDVSASPAAGKAPGKSAAEQHWLFMLDPGDAPNTMYNSSLRKHPSQDRSPPRDKNREMPRLTVLVKPAKRPAKLESLAGKLSQIMELPAAHITIRNYRDSDYAADSRDDVLLSINKEV